MKKTCLGCKALISEDQGCRNYCLLKYKVDVIRKVAAKIDYLIPYPIEKCPKPKTNMEFINARKESEHTSCF